VLFFRFLYGRQTDFKSTTLAIEVFHFADEWQVDHLAKAASAFLENTKVHEILPVFAMYNSLGQKSGIDRCLEVFCLKFCFFS